MSIPIRPTQVLTDLTHVLAAGEIAWLADGSDFVLVMGDGTTAANALPPTRRFRSEGHDSDAYAPSLVFYGDDADTPRPNIDRPVHWLGYDGTVPANAVEDAGDGTYFDLVTTVEPAESVDAPDSAPDNLSATTVSDTRIDLSWDAVAVADGYEYRVDGGDPVDVGGSLTAEVTGLDPDTEYDFEVRAYNAGGAGPWSAVVSETTDAAPSAPSAPTNLSATGGDEEVSLSWTPSAGADSHDVYRNTSDDFGTATKLTTSLDGSADSYVDEGLTNDVEVWYWITGTNAVGESDPSTPDSATPVEAVGQYETNFSEYTLNEQPHDWTSRFVETMNYEIKTVDGQPALVMTGPGTSNSRRCITWDELDAVEGRVDMEVGYICSFKDSGDGGAAFRVAGSAGNETAYATREVNFNRNITRYLDGGSDIRTTQSDVVAKDETKYRVRARVNGGVVSYRIWLDGDPEPGAWNLQNTDPEPLGAGMTGLFQFAGSSFNVTNIFWYAAAPGGGSVTFP